MGKNRGRAVSLVLSAIILCAAVVTIGAFVWAFALNFSSVMQMNYFSQVVKRVDKTRERFLIENVEYNQSSSTLRVCVYNYGEVDVNVTAYVLFSGVCVGQVSGQVIPIGEIEEIDVPVYDVGLGDELVVKVNSERGNVAYESYLVQ